MAAKDTAPAIDGEALQAFAGQVFIDLSRNHPRGYDARSTAIEAFRKARQFLAVASEIDAGTLDIGPVESIKPKRKRIQKYRAKDENTGWEPVTDDNGQPVMEERYVDRFAFCPNLPDEHPINQLFEPDDGRKPSVRVKEARAALALAN